MKKLWNDFKTFISRGNVIDLAVGVIIATAFTAIVTALTDQIIMPLINSIAGGDMMGGLITIIRQGTICEEGVGEFIKGEWRTGCTYIDWGAFITAIIDFILIAIVLFAIVEVVAALENAGKKAKAAETADAKAARKAEKEYQKACKLAKKKGEPIPERPAPEAPPEPAPAEEAVPAASADITPEMLSSATIALLTEIRDLLKTGDYAKTDSAIQKNLEGHSVDWNK